MVLLVGRVNGNEHKKLVKDADYWNYFGFRGSPV